MPGMKNEGSRVDRRGSPGEGGRRAARIRAAFTSRPVLLFAFAFAVMGDPVSSVAYSMEAGLRALGGRLALLLPTMLVVLANVVLVSVNYHQLYAMFPEGGGDAAASAAAFSEGLAFLPLAALVVDYALTIAISVAAGAPAIIAYLPWFAPARLLLAMVLLVMVTGLTLLGHGGRAVFAVMTVSFAIIGSVVILLGAQTVPGHHVVPAGAPAAQHVAPLAVLLAFLVEMALATGVEAPSSAIAQLGQLDDTGRLKFGRITLWLMVGIVIWLTAGITVVGVRLHVGVPPRSSTWIAQVTQAAVGRGALFAAFQVSSAVLLLAAASSSSGTAPCPVLRGGGVHRLLVRADLDGPPVPPGPAAVAHLGERYRRPGGRRDSDIADLARGYPIVSFVAACLLAAVFYLMWARAGRPRGIAQAERIAEYEDEPTS